MSLLMPHATDPVAPPRATEIEKLLRAARAATDVPPGIDLDGQSLELPAEGHEAILDLLQRFSEGPGVVVGSIDSLLTTSQAAELLGISRTYMVRQVRRYC